MTAGRVLGHGTRIAPGDGVPVGRGIGALAERSPDPARRDARTASRSRRSTGSSVVDLEHRVEEAQELVDLVRPWQVVGRCIGYVDARREGRIDSAYGLSRRTSAAAATMASSLNVSPVWLERPGDVLASRCRG